MDVWISTSPQNAKQISQALIKFGFAADRVPASMFQETGKVFRMGVPPIRLEILTGISGVNFAECFARRSIARWDDVEVNVISLADLKANKRASGRPKDLADLDGL